ncbi:MAG: ChaB family protein [Alphaproteobacteria bacterium]|jgi:cation transport regulator
MPYSKASDLPDSVQHVLPEHAKAIYMKAFNSAWDEYKEGSKRKLNKTREETAHSVAWAAVKKKYHKSDAGKWQEK